MSLGSQLLSEGKWMGKRKVGSICEELREGKLCLECIELEKNLFSMKKEILKKTGAVERAQMLRILGVITEDRYVS